MVAWRDVLSATPPILGGTCSLFLVGLPLIPPLGVHSLGVLDEQPADKVLGQFAGVAKVFLVEIVVHG